MDLQAQFALIILLSIRDGSHFETARDVLNQVFYEIYRFEHDMSDYNSLAEIIQDYLGLDDRWAVLFEQLLDN